MKSKIKTNRVTQLMEQNYIENHPFKPTLLPSSNSRNHLSIIKNYGEELNNSKIPIYEKLYK